MTSTATHKKTTGHKKTHHLLDIDDLSPNEIANILNLAQAQFQAQFQAQAGLADKFALTDNPTENPSSSAFLSPLKNKGVALIFEKSSLRTRHSLEMAVTKLSGHPITQEMKIGDRESAADIARTLAGYHSAIGARVFEHSTILQMAEVSSVPVFNMLSDKAHPLQALADLLTIKQTFTECKGLKVAYVGDANNVAHSLMLACHAMEISFHIAHPKGYGFADQGLLSDKGLKYEHMFVSTHDPVEAVADADVVYTDVWTSMGQEVEATKRQKAFQGYSITQELMAHAKSGAVFLHCLPAHRGQEVQAQVMDGPQSKVWQQAENRMWAAMGYLLWLNQEEMI